MTNSALDVNTVGQLMYRMVDDITQGKSISPAQILQTSMNLLMLAERNLHLDQHPEDKANGFFERELGTPMGKLILNVPRDRQANFRPALLPDKYYRDYEDKTELLESLLLNGYSPNQIQHTLQSLKLHYNPEEVEQLREHYHATFQQWQQRELPEDIIGLYIDAYHAQSLVENKVKKIVIFVLIGIDFTGQKSLFGIYHFIGNENKGFWLQTLNAIIQRGLKNPLFVISDDFSGLKEAIATLFPQAFHQLCFIHMQRNVHRNMAKSDAQTFNQALNAFKCLQDIETAKSQFQSLCLNYQKKYPSFINALSQKDEHYFAFLRLPNEIKKYFYTTNIVESFNSLLEKIRQKSGGFFQSEKILSVNVFLILQKLNSNKWKNGVPKIIAYLYPLRQLFATQYGRLPLAK